AARGDASLGPPAVDTPRDEQRAADERARRVRDEVARGVARAANEVRPEDAVGRPLEDLPERADREPERQRHDEDPDEVVALAALAEVGQDVGPGEQDADDRRDR